MTDKDIDEIVNKVWRGIFWFTAIIVISYIVAMVCYILTDGYSQ